MDDYLDIKIDVFEHTDQRARVRRSLTIHGLMEEILKEFDDISAVSPEKYAIYLKGIDKPVSKSLTIIELDLQPQDELVFEYKHQNVRENLLPEQVAYLREEKTGKLFEISWSPALIGRPTAEAEHNLMLAVNVQNIPQGITISRKHAQILFSDDQFYLEPLAETNPVTINSEKVDFGTSKEIKNNDKLTFGNQKVAMTFLTQQVPVKSKPVEHKAPPAEVISLPQAEKPAVQKSTTPAPPPVDRPPDLVPKPPEIKPMTGERPAPPTGLRLVIERSLNSESIGKVILIDSFPFVVGRTLPLLTAEEHVSRRHAEIKYDPSTQVYTLTDLKSTNGVKLDDVAIAAETPYALSQGMKIQMGLDLIVKVEFL